MSGCSCSCSWGGESIGDCVMRNRIARTIPKRGNICPNCDCPVEIGRECIDHAGLDDNGGGWFNRFHKQCWQLMEMFAEKMCHGEWCYPFYADEAAEHAFAHSDDPYWKEWLEIYEQTWEWTK